MSTPLNNTEMQRVKQLAMATAERTDISVIFEFL
jgi:hypothetical protein